MTMNDVARHTGPADSVRFPSDPRAFGGGGHPLNTPHRSECDLFDCEVEGQLPRDLDGAFFRIGPDPQYPKPPQYIHDVPFDGEGHASVFRIRNGHVDYRSRYVRTQRWKAQHAARRSLFGMYRNPLTNDPSVEGLSGGTANTQMVYHHGKLLAMKEDSPPVVLDPETLETVDDSYTFGGGMQGKTFTAHPKIDPLSGELIAFGYEARGLGSDDVEVFSCDRGGRVNWSAWIKVPYAGMIHDFAVTQRHIAFLVTPLATNMDVIKAGGPHFAWDSSLPSWLGVIRRGGDGTDLRWFKGPALMATHTMGAWSDGERLFVDVDGAPTNQFPFFPMLHERFDPVKSTGHVMRLSVDLSRKATEGYDLEVLYPDIPGALSRQDDRYHTLPYRYGVLTVGSWQSDRWALLDHQQRAARIFSAGPDTFLQEACFVPRRKGAAEADGYLIGVALRMKEGGRADLLLLDTQDIEAGPIATVKMPFRIAGQIHGIWVSGDELATRSCER